MTSETYRCFECPEHTCEYKIYPNEKIESAGMWYNMRCPLGWNAAWRKKDE